MELCNQAKIAVLICIISTMFDISLIGFNLGVFAFDVLVSIFFVLFINWLCFKDGYNFITWTIIIIAGTTTLYGIYMERSRSIISNKMKDIYTATSSPSPSMTK